MTPQMQEPWVPPWVPPCPAEPPRRGPSRGEYIGAAVTGMLALLCWAGAVCSCWFIYSGRDLPEGMVGFVGSVLLLMFEATALALMTAMVVLLRRRPLAAITVGLVGVLGIVATVLYILWLRSLPSVYDVPA